MKTIIISIVLALSACGSIEDKGVVEVNQITNECLVWINLPDDNDPYTFDVLKIKCEDYNPDEWGAE